MILSKLFRVAVRASYIALAKARGVPSRCFRMSTTRDVAVHLNYFRERLTNGERAHVPTIAYNIFNKNFVEPTLAEGFREIKNVHFVPTFNDAKERRLFFQFA